MAAFRGSVECVKSLIASGAEVNLADDADLTPLMVAAIQGCTDVVGRNQPLSREYRFSYWKTVMFSD